MRSVPLFGLPTGIQHTALPVYHKRPKPTITPKRIVGFFEFNRSDVSKCPVQKADAPIQSLA